MPAGPAAMGFVYFVATKYVGYSAFCRTGIEPWVDTDQTNQSMPSFLLAGAARTAIGVVLGATIGFCLLNIRYFSAHDNFADWLFFPLLVPVRVFEWWLLLRLIYGKFSPTMKTRALLIGTGILVSFLLDAIGIGAAWVLPGGFWVC